jgi:hypothetical protein
MRYKLRAAIILLSLSALSSATMTYSLSSQSPACGIDTSQGQRDSSLSVVFEPSQVEVNQTVQVGAGQKMTYTLPLTQGSVFVARFQVSGGANDKVNVWLVDTSNYQRLLAKQQFSYFKGVSGTIRGTGNYSFRIPQTDNYYLVVDNSTAWMLPRTVKLYCYALLPLASAQTLALQGQLNSQFGKLGELFKFSPLVIYIRHCGMVNAFSNPNITLCLELIETLAEQHLDQALSFVFFHELGHSLMRLWGQPLWDNEDAADEFATVCMMLGKLDQGALQAASWWASQTTEQEALNKIWLDDRHTLSPQRARNIIRWLGQRDELIQRWSRVLVPNMQTKVLLKEFGDSTPTLDRETVKTELQSRGCTQ